MQIEKKTLTKLFFVAVGCIVVYWLLHETERFKTVWAAVSGVLSPFVIGAVLAFILNVPMRAFERMVAFLPKQGMRRMAAILLTFIAVVLVLAAVFWLLIPQIGETIQILIPKLKEFALRMEDWVKTLLLENPELMQWLGNRVDIEKLDWAGLIEKVMAMLGDSVTVIANGAFSAVGNVTGAVVDAVIGLVFALYCLSRKEILARQGRRLLYSFLPEKTSDELVRIARLTNSTFSNFISGQCLEAMILGSLFAIAMAIFKMPYITLVSVLIAVTSLVPLVGAFVGCILGAFFILVNDPLQALIFIAMFLILQQLENNLIYPRVVGTSIGLPGMWVLVAVAVGGDMMGVAGMLLMIPLASVLYTLLREITNKRLTDRNIDNEKLQDHPPELVSKFKENRERKKKQKLLKQMKELAEKHAAQKKEHNE